MLGHQGALPVIARRSVVELVALPLGMRAANQVHAVLLESSFANQVHAILL